MTEKLKRLEVEERITLTASHLVEKTIFVITAIDFGQRGRAHVRGSKVYD